VSVPDFPRIELHGIKRLPCSACGRRLAHRTTVHQTLNPFNLMPNGTLKSREQILFELRQQLAAWHELPATHAKCEGRISVKGYCPMCGRASLVVPEEGGDVVCMHTGCPAPDAVSKLLDDRETEHLVQVTFRGWTVRHPLKERIGDALMTCRLGAYLTNVSQPEDLGTFRARLETEDPDVWSWEKIK
jgi:hypothetical protein